MFLIIFVTHQVHVNERSRTRTCSPAGCVAGSEGWAITAASCRASCFRRACASRVPFRPPACRNIDFSLSSETSIGASTSAPIQLQSYTGPYKRKAQLHVPLPDSAPMKASGTIFGLGEVPRSQHNAVRDCLLAH